MNSAASRNSFASLGSIRISSPVCRGGTPTLKKRCVHLSLQSLLVTHTVPASSLPHQVGSDRATPCVQRHPFVSSPQGSWSHGVRGLVQNDMEKGQTCAPLELGGLHCLAKGWAGRNGQAGQPAEWRIKLGSQWELWCFPFWILYQVLWLPGALADSCP